VLFAKSFKRLSITLTGTRLSIKGIEGMIKSIFTEKESAVLKHIAGLMLALIGAWLIFIVNRHLYFPTHPEMDYLTMAKILLASGSPFYLLLFAMNYLVKPFFIYGFVVILWMLVA